MTMVRYVPWLGSRGRAVHLVDGDRAFIVDEDAYVRRLPAPLRSTAVASDPGSLFVTSATPEDETVLYDVNDGRIEVAVYNVDRDQDKIVHVGGPPGVGKPLYPDGPPFITRSHERVTAWSRYASVALWGRET